MEPLRREGDIAWCPKHQAIGAILGGKFITATAEYQFAKDDIHIETCCDWQPLVPVEQVAALRAENARLRRERAEAIDKSVDLKKALTKLLQCAPDELECDSFHHFKADTHRLGEACHPLQRYRDALAAARAALEEKQ